jgi:hypothetical protein
LGGCTGMGLKDRRAHGGSVILWCRRRGYVSLWLLELLILTDILTSFAACERQSAPPTPDAAALLQNVAPADASKYPSPRQAKHWSNPYLVIRTDRVGLLTSVVVNEEQLLKPDEVVSALAQLPQSAWPYGRAVAIVVDEKPASSEKDKIALRRNRGIVEGDLEAAHVAIRWIPSS